MDQYRVYHSQIQAESFDEFRQVMTKLSLSLEHIFERVSSLETRSNALERLQDALEQRIEILDDRRGCPAEVTTDDIQEQAIQNASMLTVAGAGACSTSGYNTGSTAFGPSELPINTNYHASHNGVLLWKIDEFERRRREAVDGVTLSLYSTPFYTSRHGYKMCARVYLNGDGMGKGSHLSFFFVIMRGPFDALLQWPFKQKVTLSLINQNGKKHISDSFRPDPHSSSFQKPGRREMNIASGCPIFIRIDHLLNGGFAKDDAIYVRVVVETFA